MLTYFKIEFYRGIAPLGAMTHVLAKDGDDAAILAKAQRIQAGITDTAVEHVWEVRAADKLEKVRHLAATGFARIIDEPR